MPLVRTPIRRRDFVAMLVGTALGGVIAHPVVARAAINPAEAYVSGIADQVMDLANSGLEGDPLRARFSSLLNRFINLRAIADYALGTYKKKLPGGKQGEFYRLVGNYAAALFVFYVKDFRGSELVIISTSEQGKFIIIQTAIKLKSGGREQVKWRLTGSGGSFRVNDVNIKGVWLTISMKDRFTKVLTKSKGDFEPLFDELREAETW
ncbi:MAG: ABC transporter substrate-binding protein [Alphaproteobacteria bacterium]|nr:ABC transporter substrate-binding protein [Alphaproteobacteria bacterium]